MSSFSMEDLGFEGIEDTGPRDQTEAEKAGDELATILSKMRRDDIVTLGGVRWLVFKADGVSIYVTKAGTKGRKFYKFEPMSLVPRVLGVFQVLDGGDKLAAEPEVTDSW